MVLQDRRKLRDVLQQAVERARGQLGKRVVRGREDGEGPGTFQSVHQASRCQCFGQGFEIAIGNGDIDQRVRAVFLMLNLEHAC